MYNTGWAKIRRALDCFFTIMAEILGRYWQILSRSGMKIIPLSSLPEVKVGRNGLERRSGKRIVAGTAFWLEFQVH